MSSIDEKTQRLLDLFVHAWESADVNGLVALLKADAALAMPPSPSWYEGQNAIGVFVAATVFADGGMFSGSAAQHWRLLATRANGSPAFTVYQRDEKNEYQPFGLIALTSQGINFLKLLALLIHLCRCFLGFQQNWGAYKPDCHFVSFPKECKMDEETITWISNLNSPRLFIPPVS
jgi:hypothetical protein